jgi:hypothetical protein
VDDLGRVVVVGGAVVELDLGRVVVLDAVVDSSSSSVLVLVRVLLRVELRVLLRVELRVVALVVEPVRVGLVVGREPVLDLDPVVVVLEDGRDCDDDLAVEVLDLVIVGRDAELVLVGF